MSHKQTIQEMLDNHRAFVIVFNKIIEHGKPFIMISSQINSKGLDLELKEEIILYEDKKVHLVLQYKDIVHVVDITKENDLEQKQMYRYWVNDWKILIKQLNLQIIQRIDPDQLREVLADISHQIWSHWMSHFFSQCVTTIHNCEVNVEIKWEDWKRWTDQMKTSYHDLSEKEKNSDRDQADKIMKVLTQFINIDVINNMSEKEQ